MYQHSLRLSAAPVQLTVAQRRWKWSHEKETLPSSSGRLRRYSLWNDEYAHFSSLFVSSAACVHTHSVFSGPSVSLCALLPFWRQKRKRASPVRRDHSRVWSLGLRYKNHSGTFQSQGRPQSSSWTHTRLRAVLTSGSSSVRHRGRPLWTRAGRLYIGLWQALSLRVCPSIISHPFFWFLRGKENFPLRFFPSPCRSVLLTLYSPRLLSTALLPYLRGEVTRFLSDCLGQ